MLWQFEMLGGFEARRGEETLLRFRSQKIGILLAYLALHSGKMQSREQLVDLLWPDAIPEMGRSNLRTALASLRRQLEPPGVPEGSVLVTEGRSLIGLNREAITTDVQQFEERLRAAKKANLSARQQITCLLDAVSRYRGPLLPGMYEDWILRERDSLAGEYLNALLRLTGLQEQEGMLTEARQTAQQALRTDAFCEPAHAVVIRLLRADGQSAAAARHYAEWKALLERELGEEPPPEITALLETPPAAPMTAKTGLPVPTPRSLPAPEQKNTPPAGSDRFPTALPVETEPSGTVQLPVTLTRFFGRETEIQQLASLLQAGYEGKSERLISVTGMGGVGKTRLVIETLRKVSETFSGSLLFVPLADIQESERIPEAIARALSLPLEAESSGLEQVITALAAAPRPTLLAMDNFEQLVEKGALLPRTLLERVPGLVCLITSRQRLSLEYEREFPLAPLPTPEHSGTPERLMEFPSVALFVSRAQKARPDFQLTPHNATAIAALCARLEGLPLAIELAAAWAQTLTPARILERLERRFELLVTRRRDLPERQHTLWATIEWSFQRLEPDLQRFFAGLAVFRGGFTLAAVEAISPQSGALDKVTELCERSLLTPEEAGPKTDPEMRFGLLESLREFAAEQIGDPMPILQARHAAYYAGLALQAQPHLTGKAMQEWLERLEPERPNFRAALEWYARCGDSLAELQMAEALAAFWTVRGGYYEAREALTAALHRPTAQVPSAARADALHQLAVVLISQGDFSQAKDYSQESLSLSQALGRQEQVAVSLNLLGVIAIETGQYEAALTHYTEALALNRRLGNRLREAGNLNNLGNLALYQGDAAAAQEHYLACLEIRREAGNPSRIAMTLYNIGMTAYDREDYDTGIASCLEALAMARTLLEKRLMVACLQGLGALYTASREDAAARSVIYESLLINQELGDPTGVAGGLEVYAQLLHAIGQPEQAVFLLSAMIRLREQIRSVLSLPDRKRQESLLATLRERMDTAAFARRWQQGQAVTPEQALQWALNGLRQSPSDTVAVLLLDRTSG